MKINQEVIEKVARVQKKLLAVTKYFSGENFDILCAQLEQFPVVIGIGENRIESIVAKQIQRNRCHFIGNIQSRDIPRIAKHCSVVHSLCKLSHAQKFSQQPFEVDFFIQVNVSGETNKGGLNPNEVELFCQSLPANVLVRGISAIGAYTNDQTQKSQEFKTLLDLKNSINPAWEISAGTSVDYELALDLGIDLVRVGRGLFVE